MQKASDLARFFQPVNILWEKLRNEFKYFKIEKETPDGFKMCFIHRLYFNNLVFKIGQFQLDQSYIKF